MPKRSTKVTTRFEMLEVTVNGKQVAGGSYRRTEYADGSVEESGEGVTNLADAFKTIRDAMQPAAQKQKNKPTKRNKIP